MLVVLSSPTSSAFGFLWSLGWGGGHSGARAVRGCGELTEAARPPFRIDEGSRGTGVTLLAASPAAGLQMGGFKWGWEEKRVWEEDSQSHGDSVTPLVPYLSRGAGGCFLQGRFGFFLSFLFSVFLWSLHFQSHLQVAI